eukprot:TRINITY_DN8074_c0_g1_i1.p1 TRINITY_DN8074_c0_g1~~TRINITY_DN8074_c0_g1_i1.p1  ORF type:complete len:175 (-),score=19.50 TRINITY_DN8074_c0_g1_i1:29-553(-)
MGISLILICLFSLCFAWPEKPGDCTSVGGKMAPSIPLTDEYTIEGWPSGPNEKYVPQQVYPITINGTKHVKGILIYAFSNNSGIVGNRAGSWVDLPSYTSILSCPNSSNINATLGHNIGMVKNPQTSFTLYWTAPVLNFGPLQLSGVIVHKTSESYTFNAGIAQGSGVFPPLKF